jgi:hypothetical protein
MTLASTRNAQLCLWRGAAAIMFTTVIWIFPTPAAASPQIQTSHSLYPPRPAARTQVNRPAVTSPATRKQPMLTPEVRKRIADAKKHKQAGQKAKPSKQSKR